MTDITEPNAHEPLLLADLSSPETEERLRQIELVLIPVGAHEQHGPNIAVSTDTVSADAVCRAAAALLGPRIAVAPAIPWGISWHHMRFAGTISLRPTTLTALLADMVGSLHAHGFSHFLVVNGHGGNTAVIATAIEQIKQDLDVSLIASVFGYALIAEQARALLPADAIGHGGADEAAVVMAVAPQQAKPHAFTTPRLTHRQVETAALLRSYGGILARRYDEVTHTGTTGDATPATAEIGQQILDGAARRLAEIIEVLLRESDTA
ncbi:MAG: creatininase family protein [Chloroflexia bacterium]|nr:creatininase family protein [Chloroflexia bacterium]